MHWLESNQLHAVRALIGHLEQLLFWWHQPKPSKPHQDSTCPYASPAGVVEDRSIQMGFLRVLKTPNRSFWATFIKVTPAKTSKNPIKTPLVLLLPRWSCGGQEHPDGVSDASEDPNRSFGATFIKVTPAKDSTCPYASLAGVVEDRSCPDWVSDGSKGPQWWWFTIFV